MKSINKFLLSIAVILTVALSACEDEITRDPSPEANPGSNKVYFPEQESNLVLGVEETSFEVTIARAVTASALTVELHLSDASDMITIPESVSFGAGEAEKTFEVTLGNIELMKSYLFSIEIDVNQTDPYSETDKFPIIAFKILKEDFEPYATGDYYSGWWWEEWEAEMEYSPATEQYRIKEFCGYEGFDAYFQWDGSEVTMIGGSKIGNYTGFQTGEIHPNYGMVYAAFDGPDGPEGPFEYDEETQTFTFGYAWRVSAGSFGVDPDYYTITTLY